ncbi:hypothetical protein BZZ01_07400 [Nostocales cyanobacterium HT-58-2]|nr:hypothetical protein BZZ01_07400 [Nostocales cyanobacterium HT-58-2]
MSNNSRNDRKFISTDLWRGIDLQTVKHRIEQITAKLEAVLRKHDPEVKSDRSFHQRQDEKD